MGSAMGSGLSAKVRGPEGWRKARVILRGCGARAGPMGSTPSLRRHGIGIAGSVSFTHIPSLLRIDLTGTTSTRRRLDTLHRMVRDTVVTHVVRCVALAASGYIGRHHLARRAIRKAALDR